MQTDKLNYIQTTEETGRKPSVPKLALLFTLFGFSTYVWTKISRMIVDEMERK